MLRIFVFWLFLMNCHEIQFSAVCSVKQMLHRDFLCASPFIENRNVFKYFLEKSVFVCARWSECNISVLKPMKTNVHSTVTDWNKVNKRIKQTGKLHTLFLELLSLTYLPTNARIKLKLLWLVFTVGNDRWEHGNDVDDWETLRYLTNEGKKS